MKRILAAATVALASLPVFAEGYQINTLSSRQLGMGHTGVALKLGAESMFFNPAGLGFSDKTLDFSGSITGIKAIAKAKKISVNTVGAQSATPIDGTFSTENGISTPIFINAAFKIFKNLQAGISFYTPYGSSINWTNNWPGAELSQKVDLKVYTIQPTVAWRPIKNLSIGVGMTIAWGSVDLDKALVGGTTFDAVASAMGMPSSLGHTPAAAINLTGTSQVALGANIGVLYDIDHRWSIGANYRTRMGMDVKAGAAKVSYANDLSKGFLEPTIGLINEANFKASMPCPYVFSFGASYKPIDKLIIAADAQLTGWKTYRKLDIEFPDDLSAFNQNIAKNYKNSWAFKLGAQYQATERLDVRAGLMIDTSPVNSDHYNPETPGMTKIEPTVGISFRPIKRMSIDFAFMYIAGLGENDAKCSYDDLLLKSMGQPYKKEFKADYKVHAFAPSIGISYSF